MLSQLALAHITVGGIDYDYKLNSVNVTDMIDLTYTCIGNCKNHELTKMDIRIQLLMARIAVLESMLNLTELEPEQTEVWTCADKPGVTYEQNECQPKNDQRRCYYAMVFYHYCKTGWFLE